MQGEECLKYLIEKAKKDLNDFETFADRNETMVNIRNKMWNVRALFEAITDDDDYRDIDLDKILDALIFE